MNLFSILFFIVGIFAISLGLIAKRSRRNTRELYNGLSNGVYPDGVINKTVDAALGRYRLVKEGAAPGSVQVAGAADRPWGLTDDEAVNTTDSVSIRVLGAQKGTVRMISDASAAIAYGDLLVPAANGAVKTIAAGAGNYYVVGRALEAVANGAADEFMVAPCGYGLTK